MILGDGNIEFEQGEIFEAVATFTNSGGEPFIDVPVRWYLDDTHIADDNIRHWNIENDDEKQEDINIDTLGLSVGTHKLKVVADFNDDENTRDNYLEITFEVVEIETEPEILGDINKDGVVDIFDYNLLKENLGQTGENIADLNDDKVVDIFDYNILKENWTN
jgi:hypothetical protein